MSRLPQTVRWSKQFGGGSHREKTAIISVVRTIHGTDIPADSCCFSIFPAAMIMTIPARRNGFDTSGSDPRYQIGSGVGLAGGVSDGTTPGGSITREQLAAMLWRYAGEPAVTRSLASYSDAGNVSSWANKAYGLGCSERFRRQTESAGHCPSL